MPDEAFLLGMPGACATGTMTVKVVTVFESNRELRATWRRSASTTRAPAPAWRSWTAPTSPRSAPARPPPSPPTCSPATDARDAGDHRRRRPGRAPPADVPARARLRRDPHQLALPRGRRAPRRAAPATRARSTTPRTAVRGADVVALATHAAQPVIEPDWIAPGTHVSSVGYRPPDGELPRALLTSARLFVETREAFEPPPVGCAELDRARPATTATELGDGPARPRARPHQRRDEITSTRRWATSWRTSSPPSSSSPPPADRRRGTDDHALTAPRASLLGDELVEAGRAPSRRPSRAGTASSRAAAPFGAERLPRPLPEAEADRRGRRSARRRSRTRACTSLTTGRPVAENV